MKTRLSSGCWWLKRQGVAMQAGASVTGNSVVVPGSLGLHGLLNRRSGSTGGWTWGPAMPLGTLTLCVLLALRMPRVLMWLLSLILTAVRER